MATTTPWGKSQYSKPLTRGIIFYGTAGHGGYHVSKKLNALIPERVRDRGGWYEEDCAWAIPIVFLKPVLRGAIPDDHFKDALDRFKSDFWQDYEALFGEVVDPKDSYSKRQWIFKQEHINDYQTLAAYGDWHDKVPAGMVGVFACRGGRKSNGHYGDDQAYFLVPNDEYNNRGEYSFIIDPARHQQVEDFSK